VDGRECLLVREKEDELTFDQVPTRDLVSVSLAKPTFQKTWGRCRISFHAQVSTAVKFMFNITFSGTHLKPGLRCGTNGFR